MTGFRTRKLDPPTPRLRRASRSEQRDLRDLAFRIARQKSLDPATVCAVIEQESAWNTYAIRSESKSGFARRYGRAYARIVRQTVSKRDDRWFRYPDIFYTSYGLMQVMYPVAVEQLGGDDLQYPTLLCMPEIGISYGCSLLALKIRAAGGAVHKGLLYYNGGGNPRYPDEVLERVGKYRNYFARRAAA